jgi:hypothetical protein
VDELSHDEKMRDVHTNQCPQCGSELTLLHADESAGVCDVCGWGWALNDPNEYYDPDAYCDCPACSGEEEYPTRYELDLFGVGFQN